MADNPIKENINTLPDSHEPRSPGVDYGLKNDDGFDPSKYDFYNPSYRTAGTAFFVRVDGYVYYVRARQISAMLSGFQETSTGIHCSR